MFTICCFWRINFLAFFEAVRLAFDVNNGAVMQDTIQDSGGNGDVGKDLVPREKVLLDVKTVEVFSYRLAINWKNRFAL